MEAKILEKNLLKNKQGLTEEEFLAQYDAGKYERPSVTVDMIVFTVIDGQLKILMIKRADHPSIGQWALPGGFVNIDEDLDRAAERELKEETSLENIYMEQVYTWGDVGRDPRTRIITVAYMALVDSRNLNVKADDDAADADWFNIECEPISKNEFDDLDASYCKLSLKSDRQSLSAILKIKRIHSGKTVKTVRTIVEKHDIATDHSKIIEYALETLRYKALHTDIIFNLMPDKFDIDELKNMYTIVTSDINSDRFIENIKNRLVLDSNKYRLAD